MGLFRVTLTNQSTGWPVHQTTVKADSADTAIAAAKTEVPYHDQISFLSAVTELPAETAEEASEVREAVKSAEEKIIDSLPQSVIDLIKGADK